jgi:hypothetical protein
MPAMTEALRPVYVYPRGGGPVLVEARKPLPDDIAWWCFKGDDAWRDYDPKIKCPWEAKGE